MSQQTPYRSTAALWSKKLWGTGTGSNERLFFPKDFWSESKKFPFLPVERKPDISHVLSSPTRMPPFPTARMDTKLQKISKSFST